MINENREKMLIPALTSAGIHNATTPRFIQRTTNDSSEPLLKAYSSALCHKRLKDRQIVPPMKKFINLENCRGKILEEGGRPLLWTF